MKFSDTIQPSLTDARTALNAATIALKTLEAACKSSAGNTDLDSEPVDSAQAAISPAMEALSAFNNAMEQTRHAASTLAFAGQGALLTILNRKEQSRREAKEEAARLARVEAFKAQEAADAQRLEQRRQGLLV